MATRPLADQSTLLRIGKGGALEARVWSIDVVDGPDRGASMKLEGALVVGSRAGAGLSLTDDTVSRAHLQLEPRPDGVWVRDLESTNGTRVRGLRIQEGLVDSDSVLELGNTRLRVWAADTQLPSPAAATATPWECALGVLEQAAASKSTVLLEGETGSGKSQLAKWVHDKSPRAQRAFVTFDCGAVNPNLIESELFGHKRGAFTGADADRPGAFVEADGGTLFIDEIGELPLQLQPRLLRVVESSQIKRLGADNPRTVDVRLIAATHRDLKAEVKAGRFREDLYFRLAVIPVTVPPLRERRAEIPQLVRDMLKAHGEANFDVPDETMKQLQAFAWPGNLRELRNVVERAVTLGRLELHQTQAVEVPPFKEAKQQLVDSFTRDYVKTLLAACGGNVTQAALKAQVARSYLQRLMSEYQLRGTDE